MRFAFFLGTSLTVLASTALAQSPDPSGIDFVTIGAPGNAAWQGNGTPNDRAVGRGSVNYEYRIGRFEVTTSQWVEFFNAAFDRPANDRLPHLILPDFWGASSTTPTTPGGQRWTVPAGNEMLPVGYISWRMAAMYCNWLHNDKSTARSAFLNGAYDVSTFTYTGTVFNDQFTHNPDAKYWIPTWNEWLKAAHYDPNRNGPGQGGWWTSPNGTDTPLVYGPPGVLVNGQPTQANAGWNEVNFPGFSPFNIALGSYANVLSPWGLFDVAGGTTEWTEEVLLVNDLFPAYRLFDGTAWADPGANRVRDQLSSWAGDFPSLSTYDLGFRIATSVPAPASCIVMASLCLAPIHRRRRAS